MRKVRLVLIFCLMLSIFGGLFLLRGKNEYSYYLAIGDYLSKEQNQNGEEVQSFANYFGNYLLDNHEVKAVSNTYSLNNMTSKKMLEIIEGETSNEDDDKLAKLIKKSKYITISLGINDILNQVKYDSLEDKLVYDKDLIKNKIEICKYNYYKVVEEIKDINDNAKVILVGYYDIYGDSEIVSALNESIKDVAIDTGAVYIDNSALKDNYLYKENKLYLTSLGHEEISRKIIEAIKR